MNFIVAKVTLFILVISTVKCQGSEDEEFKEEKYISGVVIKWLKNIVNPKYAILSKIENEALENKKAFKDLPLIFTSAQSCNDPGARWDYKFTGAENKRKLKAGKTLKFNGKGRLTLNMKQQSIYGVKNAKCIYYDDISLVHISGRFKNDSLEGPVQLKYKNGTTYVATAIHSKIVGNLREFDSSGKLVNFHGQRPMNLSENAVYNVSWNYKVQMYEIYTQSLANDGRIMFSKNLMDFLNCEKWDSSILKKCYKIKKLDGKFSGENFLIKDETTEEEKKYQFDHLKTSNSQPNIEKSFKFIKGFCNDGKNDWTTENMGDIIESWINTMSINSEPSINELEAWIESLANDGEDEGIFANVDEEVHLPVSDMNYRKVFSRKIPVINMTTNEGLFVPGMNVRLDMKSNSIVFKNVKENNLAEKLKLGSLILSTKTGPNLLNMKTLGKSGIDYEGFLMRGRVRKGNWFGIVRSWGRWIRDKTDMCSTKSFPGLGFVARYSKDGKISGPSWRFAAGSPLPGIIYGLTDENGQHTGNDIVYLYPDFETAYIGKFEEGVMREGRETTLTGVRCNRGMLELKFDEPPQNERVFKYERPTSESFGDQPLMTDILDMKYVEVRKSDIMHKNSTQGAFAKRDIKAGYLLSLYSGLRFTDKEKKAYFDTKNELIKESFGHLSSEEQHEGHWYHYKYAGILAECDLGRANIDIPTHLGKGLSYFAATLGHKLNHQFDPSAQFGGFLDSPRFGPIRAFFALKDIKKGDEMFINYGYSPIHGPKWYRELFISFMDEQKARGNFEKMGRSYMEAYQAIKSGKYNNIIKKSEGNERGMSLGDEKDNEENENVI